MTARTDAQMADIYTRAAAHIEALEAELARLRAVCAEVARELRTLAGVLHESGRGRNACDVETLAKDLDKEAKGTT